jgi:hypothetical protein
MKKNKTYHENHVKILMCQVQAHESQVQVPEWDLSPNPALEYYISCLTSSSIKSIKKTHIFVVC